jgi:hypothetical protein
MVVGALAAVVASGCAENGNTPDPTEPGVVMVPVYAKGDAPGQTDHFRTHATGDEEVPANASQAQGQAMFKLSEDGTALHYKVIVANIENVTQSHIHRAAKGVNGGIVVWLYPSAPPLQLIPGRSQGVLAEGVITSANVIGSLGAEGLAGLLREMRAGNTYVNVHTSQFPPGEIRGQLD